MMCRLSVFLILVLNAVLAQGTFTVKQIVEFVRSSAKQKLPDKAVADQLHRMRLSEKLTETDIQQLLADGPGPHTVDALKQMSAASSLLLAPRTSSLSAPLPYKQATPPSGEKQNEVIEATREYALNYSKSLPDFVCAQITTRYDDPTGKQNFRQGDVIKTKLSYNGKKENYEVLMVNERSVSGKSMDSLGGTTSTGEFATMMRFIFEPASQASFGWERWTTLRGNISYVFHYKVEQQRSGWTIVDTVTNRTVTPGYRGLIYIDRKSGQILRVTLESIDIPSDFPIQVANEQLDYDWADLSGNKFLLPSISDVRLDRGSYQSRNEVRFTSYRKFSSDAVISFDEVTQDSAKK